MPKYDSQSDVIRAIKKASDAELRALADISKQLQSMGGMRYVKAANAGKFRPPQHNHLGEAISSAIQAQTGNRSGSRRNPKRAAISSIPAQISASTVRKTKKALQDAVNDTLESVTDAVLDSIESDIKAGIGTKSAQKRTTRKAPTGKAPEGHYYDKAGRLRTNNGRYASQAANERSRNSRQEDRDTAETNGLLKKMISGLGKSAANGLNHEGAGDIGAGAAGMGVMWQASKELAAVVGSAGKNTIEMSKFINDGRKTLQKGITRGFSANDARASVKENQEIRSAEAAKEQHKDNVDTHANQEREIALLQEIAHKVGGAGGEGGGGILSKIGSVIGGGLGLGMLKRGYSAIRRRLPGGKGKLATVAEEGAEDLAKVAKKGAGKAAAEVGEKGAEKLAAGSIAKAGGSLLEKGALKGAAKIGMRAIPILGTIAGIGYDAYEGWNDNESLKSTFGKNAGTQQRAAQAAANVADLGGIISGSSNLISGVLDKMGFSSASAAFQMNGSTGLAKKFDGWFTDSENAAEDLKNAIVDKLGEVVKGIDSLAPGVAQTLTTAATQLANDNASLTGSRLKMADTTVYNVNDATNKQRKAAGKTYNPQAQITLEGNSRGISNNNPLNLNFANQKGAMKEAGKGGRFAAFATPEEGIRAAGNQLLRNKNAHGAKTLGQMISMWAPASENDVPAYIKSVASSLGPGYNANTPVDPNDPEFTARLIQAMGTHENGSFNMSLADIKTSLGSVQNGKYVGGWTGTTKDVLSKTDAGKAILASNTGAGAPAITTPAPAAKPGIPVKPSTPAAAGNIFAGLVGGWMNAIHAGVNNTAAAMVPGLKYSNANAALGLGGVTRAKLNPVLNGDALVNASRKNALPTPATLSQGGGLLSDVFTQATQAISGGNIMNQLTHGLNPNLQYMAQPLIGAAGKGIDSVLNLGRQTVGGWLNGSSATQRSVTDLSASGARLSPDSSVTKAQDKQQTTLEEIASYLEQILGIQKKPAAGGANHLKPGPQPGPSGDIPLGSNSSVLNTILRRNSR